VVLVLREERRARIEKLVVPAPKPSWRARLSDWLNERPPRPETQILYEFSVGKYTFMGEVAKTWEFVRIPAEELIRASETQKVTPVLVMRNGYGKRWWWYLGRFYREAVGLTAGEVHEHALRIRRAQEEEERRLLYQDTRAQRTDPTPQPASGAADGRPSGPTLAEDLAPSRRAQTGTSASEDVRLTA
jgi:hypothetical protein